MGAVIFMVIGAYLLISFGVMAWAISYAKKNGKSAIRWWLGAALVMFLIPCWDWIPTVVVHKYYCEKDSGFWVYKTLEQWKVENPGVMEGLHPIVQPIQRVSYGYLQVLDERFAVETHRKIPVPLLTTQVDEELLVDRKTGEILAKGVSVGSGVGNMATGGGLKFWLNQSPCIARDFWKLTAEIERTRGTK